MALIDSTTLLGIADRCAAQYGYLKTAFDSISLTGGVSACNSYYWQMITATDDPDVEIPLESTYYNSDINLSLVTCVRSGTPQLTSIVTTMDNHFSRVSHSGSWDGFLTTNDERVSDYFNKVYYIAKGSYMLANNVFSEADDVFGTAEVEAGPSVTFTDGDDYGDGSASNRASGSYFAATQLKVVCVGAIGATDLDLRLSVKDEDDVATTIDVTVPALSLDGAEIDVGTVTDRFLDVTGIDFQPAADQGTLGDTVNVQNKKERSSCF